MKKLVIIGIAVLMVSCKNKTNTDDAKVLGTSAEEAAKEKAPAPTVIIKERTVVEHVPVQTETVTTTTTVKKKKGLSKTTKGALIGTAAGAAAGALIDKNNRGVGALVGGAIGSGAGYGIGAAQDKKDKKTGQ